MRIHSPRASPSGDEPPAAIYQGKGKHRHEASGLPCGRLRAGLLAVLGGFGGDGGGTFGAELEPVLEVLLLLGLNGFGHLMVPRAGDIHDWYAMSILNELSQIIKIFLK
jgi:hypothetical protein